MTFQCFTDTYPKARKDHVCSECGRPIRKGVIYHHQKGIFDGSAYAWKVHKDCGGLFFKINRDWGYDEEEQQSLDAFSLCEIRPYRGHFPHAVCRIEFRRGAQAQGGGV